MNIVPKQLAKKFAALSFYKRKESHYTASLSPRDLKKTYASNISELYICLEEFSKTIKNFQMKLEEIILLLDELLKFIPEKLNDCRDDLYWKLISTFLQKFYDSFNPKDRNECYIYAITSKADSVKCICHHGKELASFGTPV